MSEMDNTRQEEEQIEGERSNRGLIILVVVGILGLIAACVFAWLLLRPTEDGVVDDIAATETPVFVSVPQGVSVIVQDGTGTITTTVESPVSLQVAGRDFAVRSQLISADGIWVPSVQGEGTAVWVYGSIINYVLGLPDSDENRALMEQLMLGDEIKLITQGEREHTFSFNNREIVPKTNRDIFAQRSPGVTLVLIGSDSDQERLVVHGSYVAPDPNSGSGDNVFELGEPAQLETAQITVLGATYLPDRLEAPPGFAFFLVDFQIQNTGLTALDTSQLQLSLLDQLGNQYGVNSQASQLGNYPALGGFVNSGQLVQGTIGYQIPIGLVSPTLNWSVFDLQSRGQIQVTIPFNVGAEASEGVLIALDSVTVSDDLTQLVLLGSIANGGTQPLIIGEQNIALQTADGAIHLLVSTNPAFPWSVAPGQTLSFAVSFQRPPSPNAIFTVLNQQFELSNLR